MNRISAVCAGLLLAGSAFAEVINVPDDYLSIQDAIDMSSDGDVVLIAAGSYNEYDLNPFGKAITIQGTVNTNGTLATIIDAQKNGSVFVINNGESDETVIKDLVMTKGRGTLVGYDLIGGGIYLEMSSPTITGCTITSNTADAAVGKGGGIYCRYNSNPTIINCTITSNTADGVVGKGGAIYCELSSPVITNCNITANTADGIVGKGGGIYCEFSNPVITNCNITTNTADGIVGKGGGIYCEFSSPTLLNA